MGCKDISVAFWKRSFPMPQMPYIQQWTCGSGWRLPLLLRHFACLCRACSPLPYKFVLRLRKKNLSRPENASPAPSSLTLAFPALQLLLFLEQRAAGALLCAPKPLVRSRTR